MIAAMLPIGRRLNWVVLALGCTIAVHGCTGRPPDADGFSERATPEAQAALPPGAIKIDDQLYQVPIGADDDGCARYRLH